MSRAQEQELPEVVLVSEEERTLRPLYNDFYKHLSEGSDEEVRGPNALMDTSFDRMRHERLVVGFLVGRVAAKGALGEVLQDARLREGRVIYKEQLAQMITTSLTRVRKQGEWDNTPESREVRKQLLRKGLSEHRKYPLVSEAITLGEMLEHDGHEVYAQDAVVAITKWLERVERRKAVLITSSTGNPAA